MNLATQPKPSFRPKEEEIAPLLKLSARIGCDPQLVQGHNGNTSLKLDGVIWIKASGKWLANAKQEGTFVPVELALVKESMRRNVEIGQLYKPGNQLRPSIETAMHAVLQHRVVLHVHSVNTIARAVRRDGPSQLTRRLAGLDWQWVPYTSSGIPLAKEIAQLLSVAPETNVFILGNHGLVVCGNDCEGAEALLDEVERRLAVIPRLSPEPETARLGELSSCSRWRVPDVPAVHALGTDPISRRILRGGVLYPCQAIFLGPRIAMLPYSIPSSQFAEYSDGKAAETPAYVIIEGVGVIVSEKINCAEYATLVGLVEIVQRIDEFAPLRYLTATEIAYVLGDVTKLYRGASMVGH